MPRLNVREIEDYPWVPSVVRDAITAFLRTITALLRPFDGAAPVLVALLPLSRRPRAAAAAAADRPTDPAPAEASQNRIVDLCSGGGGALVDLMLRPGLLPADCTAALTDLYPNEGAFAFLERRLPGRVFGVKTPVDAGAVAAGADGDAGAGAVGGGRRSGEAGEDGDRPSAALSLRGVRTIFNALHHLPPQSVEAAMRDARRANEPFAAFEVVERHPLALLAFFFAMPFVPFFLMPFSRPLRPLNLLLTYVVPVVPLVAAVDGFLSCLRAYSLEELEGFCAGANREAAAEAKAAALVAGGDGALAPGPPPPPAYVWRVGVAPRDLFGLMPFRLVWLEGRPGSSLAA